MCFSHSLSIYQFNYINQCNILASGKNECFLDLLCENVFSTFQFSHLAASQREDFPKDPQVQLFHQLQKFCLKKIEDFLELLCECLLNFSVFHLTREKISQIFFHQLQKFCLRKKLKISLDLVREWLLNFSVFRLTQSTLTLKCIVGHCIVRCHITTISYK